MGPTVEGAVVAFLQSRRTRRHKTYDRYRQYLNNFVDWCLAHNPQVKYLEQVKVATIREFVIFLQRKEQAETTIQNKTKYVKTFLKWCSLEDEFEYFVSEREVRKIEIPKVHDKEITIFSDEEVSALMRAASANKDIPRARRNIAILLTLLDTGCRASEITVDSERPEEQTGMYLSDLVLNDPKDPRIKINGKGGKPREVPVGEKTSKALRLYINRYREETSPEKGHLFFSRGTTPLTVWGLQDILKRIGKAAGVEDVHAHKFRHTFAVKYLLKTRDIYGLSRLLGHGSVDVTERYLRGLNLKDIRARGSIIDDMF